MASTKKVRKINGNRDVEDRVASTSELARRLNLSRWTVSRVLNGHPGVHPDTVRLVQDAMTQFGFNANPLARGLRLGRTNIIGVCVPDIEHFYLSQKLAILRHALDREGFHVMLGITNGEANDEISTLNHFSALCAAGVVLFASKLPQSHSAITRFGNSSTPLIRVDPFGKVGTECVFVDRAAVMRTATKHLIELGHRHIATLGLVNNVEGTYSNTRFNGVLATLRAHRGVTGTHLDLPSGTFSYKAGQNTADILVSMKKERPTAILCLNDRIAIGLIHRLSELGYYVPQDFSVIGWDNMEAGAFLSPALTSIDTHPDELIGATTARLLQQIRHPGEAPLPRVNIRPDLVIRSSTGPAPSKSR